MRYLPLAVALAASLAASAQAAPVALHGNAQPAILRTGGFVQPSQRISKRQAEADALQVTGGGTVTEIKRDDFHDIRVWDVTIVNPPYRYQIDVDASNGNIVRARRQRL